MKKILFIVLVLCLSSLFAELYPARRYVELGVGASVLTTQNAMPAADIFKKNLVLDLNKLASGMNKNGFVASASANPEFHLAFNFEDFAFALNFQSEVSGRLNISKEFFDILARGIKPGSSYTADGNFWVESFVSFSVPVRFNVGDLRIRVEPACFAPVVYIPSTTITAKAVNGNDGSVNISATAPLEIYTVSHFKGLIKDGSISFDFLKDFDGSALASDMARSLGVDLSALVEYPVLDTLDVGGYVNIPIVPARLKHKVTANATITANANSLLQVIVDEEKFSHSAEITDATYGNANYMVNRPLRFGAECAWRPAGEWLTMRASAGLGMRNPFGEDFSIKSVYPEYRLGIEIVGVRMFGLALSTEYTKKVFAHSVGIMLNFRAIEFDIAAAVSSPTFIESFKGEGVVVGCGVKLGW